jgi:hypothetical protein
MKEAHLHPGGGANLKETYRKKNHLILIVIV